MKAAVLETVPGELVIDDVQLATPGPREVLVRTVAAGLCHSDLHFMEGLYPIAVPTVLGHESAGVVEAVGDQVRYVAPGDHVITCVSGFCGACDYCLSGRPNLCTKQAILPDPTTPRLPAAATRVFQFMDLSSFAEQLLVHENYLVKIRPEMPLDKAALLGCGVTTGVGAVHQHGEGAPRRDGRGDRLRRHRPQCNSGRRHRGRGARHRGRPGAVEARAGARVRRHRHRQRVGGRRGARGARAVGSGASTMPSRRSGSRPLRSRRSRCCATVVPRR